MTSKSSGEKAKPKDDRVTSGMDEILNAEREQQAAAKLTPTKDNPHLLAKSGPWLHAWYDPMASLQVHGDCMQFVNLNGDGDWQLLVADHSKKLKVYKGTSVVKEHSLLDTPVALASFYTQTNAPRTPAVAVAAGSHVFIYRNMRPYYKFTVPAKEVEAAELSVWKDLAEGAMDTSAAADSLRQAREKGTALTYRSAELLALEDREAREQLVERCKGLPLAHHTTITCLGSIKKDSEQDDAVSTLVIGTESCQVLFLDPPATIIAGVTLPAVPVFLAISGLFEVDWRVVVACRDGKLYTVKNGEVRRTAVLTGTVMDLETQPCALAWAQKSVCVATADKRLHCYQPKGRKNWTLHLERAVTCLQPLVTRSTNCLLAALDNGEVRIYNGKTLIHTLQTGGQLVAAMQFGHFAREENTLAVVGRNGALSIKMLNRSANLEPPHNQPGPPPEQDVPLNVPKKTKLYVEQQQREREQAVEMHRVFQRDLCKLRLHTARTYVKIITNGQMGVSPAGGAALRLQAECQGLGPNFKIRLHLQNGGSKALTQVPLVFNFDSALYSMAQRQRVLPTLLPGVLNHLESSITCVDPTGASGAVRVIVLQPGSSVPLVFAVVNMPPSELKEEL